MVSTLDGYQHLRDAESLLHKRLTHLNHQAVHHVLTSGSDTHTADGSHKFQCSTYILSKQHRTRSQEPAKHAGSPFELIHSDSCGPLPLAHGSARYYIIFIDNLTRYIFVYFLKAKQGEDSRKCFENVLNYVETQFPEYKVKRFRSDNGKGEYDNSLFRELLPSKGIIFQPSPPYTQHKNGLSERMIQILNSRAQSMLIDADLPIIFLAEAINAAVYLHHRSPSSALEGKSPLEALRPAEPIPWAHLCRFGCIAYHRIPAKTRNVSLTKFTPRARLCIMVGYSESTKIWRLWDFLGNSGRGWPIYSSDVVFIEEKNAINWQPDHEQPLEAGSLSLVYFAPVHPCRNEFTVTPQAEIDLFLKAPDIMLETLDDALPQEAQSGSAELAPPEQGEWIDYFHPCSTIYEDMCFPFSLLFSGCLSVTPSYGVGRLFSLDSWNCTSTFVRLPSLSLSGWVLRLLILRLEANSCSLCLSRSVLQLFEYRLKANHCSLSLDGCYNCWYTGRRQISVLI